MNCPYCKENELEMYISKKEGYKIVCSLCSASWHELDVNKVKEKQ